MATDRSKGSVRIGPISIFSLVIVLCLAVLSVLAVTTAQATYTLADKQAKFNTDTYVNEIAGQEFLSKVDASLASSRTQKATHEQALASLKSILPADAALEGNTLTASFSTEGGRLLSITLEITPDNQYRISEWSATTQWEMQDTGGTLWTGNTK